MKFILTKYYLIFMDFSLRKEESWANLKGSMTRELWAAIGDYICLHYRAVRSPDNEISVKKALY